MNKIYYARTINKTIYKNKYMQENLLSIQTNTGTINFSRRLRSTVCSFTFIHNYIYKYLNNSPGFNLRWRNEKSMHVQTYNHRRSMHSFSCNCNVPSKIQKSRHPHSKFNGCLNYSALHSQWTITTATCTTLILVTMYHN